MTTTHYNIIVIGAGHAGCEAALACEFSLILDPSPKAGRKLRLLLAQASRIRRRKLQNL